MMTREEHLAWAKKRALEYFERGDYFNAVVSMLSDLNKHDELEKHPGIEIGGMMFLNGQWQDRESVYLFIVGFH